jgi:hypothetical protein
VRLIIPTENKKNGNNLSFIKNKNNTNTKTKLEIDWKNLSGDRNDEELSSIFLETNKLDFSETNLSATASIIIRREVSP